MIENPNVICNDCAFCKQNKELKDKCERLEKQLEIAVEALKCYKQENWSYADTYDYYRLDLYEGGWIHAERALHEIKELEK